MRKILNSFCRSMLLSVLILCLMSSLSPLPTVHAKSVNDPNIVGSINKNDIAIDSTGNKNNLKLNKRSLKLIKGKKTRITVMNLDSKHIVSYSSSNKNIATVNKQGYIHGLRNGTATVYATVKYRNRTIRKLSCSVTVGPAAVSIVIPKSKVNVTLGKKHYINYIIKASNTVETPTFHTSNRKVATVSNTGVVTTHSVGKATITIKIKNGKSDTCTITVKKRAHKANKKK